MPPSAPITQQHGIKNTVSYQIAQVAKLHRKRASLLLGEIGLHAGQEMIMDVLWEDDGLSQRELANKLGIEPATLTVSLKYLERNGFVSRERDLNDQRVIRVCVTEKGTALQESVVAVWQMLEDETIGGLTPEECASLDELLVEVRRNLEHAQ